jgi:hypothetical protein
MFNKIKSANTVQKVVFTFWIILTALSINGIFSNPNDTDAPGFWFGVLFLSSVVSFILYRVWANKEN